MRVAFAGTPEFAAMALHRIIEAGFAVTLVLTQPDRPAGRGLKLAASPVKQLALEHALPLCQPRSLKLDGQFADDAQAAQRALAGAAADVMVVAAYGLILPAWVLARPAQGCLNIHGSLLPRWRGAAPVQRAIEAGDPVSGITIMQMDQGLDTGPMIAVRPTAIEPVDTAATLTARLGAIGAALIVEVLNTIRQHSLRAVPQPAEGATYAHKIDKREAPIDWRAGADLVERRIRAFDPFPGASFELDGEVVKVWRAAVREGIDAPAGTVAGLGPDRLTVACGAGGIDVLEVQRPGGRRQLVAAWLAARPGLVVGQILGQIQGQTLGLDAAQSPVK